MPYITMMRKNHILYPQLSLDDILGGEVDIPEETEPDKTCTITRFVDNVPMRMYNFINTAELIEALRDFNRRYEGLINTDRKSLYHTFHIPKQSGGLRRIDAPKAELKEALYDLKKIFEEKFHALYHTTAFAYVKDRCPLDSVKKHQMNKSWWFFKSDFSNFFGSSTPQFVFSMLSQIWPFSEVAKWAPQELKTALSLCFLDGGLPQGTPISPLLSNLEMLPVDFILAKRLRAEGFVYTRYADDILISHRHDFKPEYVSNIIVETLQKFNAPFSIKPEKTRYGSRAGSNWNLGVMLNQENQITIGYQKKKQFNAMCNSYILDKLHGRSWDLTDVQVFSGQIAYYLGVEKQNILDIIKKYNDKYHVNMMAMIQKDLRHEI